MTTGLISPDKIEEYKAKILEDLTKHPVLVYLNGDKRFPQCSHSAHVIEILDMIETPYEVIDCLEDPITSIAIQEFSKWPNVPQLYIKQEFIGGFDIIKDLFFSGELQNMLLDL